MPGSVQNANTPPGDRNGPGVRLAQARDELGLPVKEVARMLNLSPSHITALENDDYESLFGPTYVRGYLRSYAQLLGLPPEEIDWLIAYLETQTGAAP